MSDVERELRELAARAEWPPPAGAAERAARILAARAPSRRVRRRRRAWRGGVVALATLVAGAGAAVASPDIRHAIRSALGIGGVEVHRSDRPANARASDRLSLGAPSTLADARRAAGFPLATRSSALGPPEAVFVRHGFPGGGVQVSYVYGRRPHRRSARTGPVAFVLSQFRARSLPYLDKTAVGATVVTRVRVGGARGVWLAGAPHEQVYRGPDGLIRPDTLRLATNTLIWEQRGVTLRLEGAVTRSQAVRIAASLR